MLKAAFNKERWFFPDGLRMAEAAAFAARLAAPGGFAKNPFPLGESSTMKALSMP